MRPAGVGVLQLEIADEITGEMADTIARYAAADPDREIEVYVDTPGGDWSSSVGIFTALKNHGRRVVANIRRAASGGALIALAGDYRRMDPDGYFFLHRPSGDYPKATLDDIANRKAGLMASRCRVPATRLRDWMDRTVTIGAKRALDIGMVDEVPGLPRPRHPVVVL